MAVQAGADQWPATELPGATLRDLLEAAAARFASAPALITPQGVLDYAGLHARAGRIARLLADRGLGPEQSVGLLIPRSPLLLQAMLGTTLCGAAFMPLDPGSPPARLAALVTAARPACILASANLAPALPPGANLILLDDPEVLAGIDGLAPLLPQQRPRLHPGHPAYILHTSGSTGAPKGVVIPHGAIAGYVRSLAALVDREAGAADMPWFTAPTFDLTLTSVLVPLCTGATVQVFPDARPEDALAAIFAPDSPSRAVKLTPSHAALLEALPEAAPNSRLRLAILGGESLAEAHLRLLRRRAPGLRILNEYGPTEVTIGAVAGFAEPADHDADQAAPIGRPYPGVGAFILDPQLRQVPPGVPGELYLAGPLARGYLGRPALTAARFVAAPSGPPGTRLYRTGDIASLRPDGQMLFHGRADDQIKLRGHRIEPGEIEAALLALPGLAQAAVAARPDPAGEPRLVAWVAPVGLDPGWLRDRLAARLPAWMVPDAFLALDRLPLTANGKLDRARLPDPVFSSGDAFVEPSTPEERLLAGLLADLLRSPRIGTGDHFFRIGGHSLLAARLIARIRQHSGRSLPIRAVFDNPVIADLARRLATTPPDAPAQPTEDGYDVVLPIRLRGNSLPLFCLHPVVGLCWPYLGLLPFTSEDQPIYGIQSPGARMGSPFPPRIEDLLGTMLAAILRTAPTGSLRLMGWSFGGVLAHLMATRLQAAGRKLDRLIIVDAYPPWRPPGGIYPLDPRPDGLWRDLAFGFDIDLPGLIPYGSLDPDALLQTARAQHHPAGELSLPELYHFASVMAGNTRFMADISFDLFDGDIAFIAADIRPPGFDPARMNPEAWRPYCTGEIQVQVVHSTHNRLLQPESLRQLKKNGPRDR